jgi:hypothetical protein
MSDEEEPQVHGFGIPLPAGLVQAITEGHETRLGFAEDRYNLAMRWLDGLDVEGLLALRWVLSVGDADDANANNKWFDGICFQLLRTRGVDPRSGRDPAAELLEREAARAEN